MECKLKKCDTKSVTSHSNAKKGIKVSALIHPNMKRKREKGSMCGYGGEAVTFFL